MASRSYRLVALTALVGLVSSYSAQASAYLFWRPPSFAGTPVKGDEPGIGIALPKATDKEYDAHLLWNLRAGLNVAALQCQFAPALMTVRNYNDVLRQHGAELNDAYTTLTGYFKRVNKKTWQTDLDQYTTRTYNGFSTLYAQIGFCETAGAIGRDALERRKGDLRLTAETKMREFRNSLVPAGDGLYGTRPAGLSVQLTMPPLDDKCWDKNNQLRKKCGGAA